MVPVQELLDLLPRGLLTSFAVTFGVNAANQIRLRGETVFVCLLNGLVNHPMLTQRLLADVYQQQMGHPTDHSSFGRRLGAIDPAYFQALFTHLYRRIQPALTPAEARQLPAGLRLRLVDATVVTLSAKLLQFGLFQKASGRKGTGPAKRSVKSVFELSADGLPQLLRLCREAGERSDNRAMGDPMGEASQPGDLWVFDRGCNDRTRLLTLHQARAFFLTLHHQQKLRVLKSLFEACSPTANLPTPTEPTCRVLRAELAVFENSTDSRSAKLQEQWTAMPLVVVHCERYDVRKRKWTPLVLLTNLPLAAQGEQVGPFTFAELAEVYRWRWEIEVFFKFLKQHLGYRHLTSRSENGLQVTIMMALIAALILIWYRRRTGIASGWRSVKFWLAEDARGWTQALLERDLRDLPAP